MRERHSAEGRAITPYPAMSAFAGPHCTVAEISKMWKLSSDTVRRLFVNEPGVLVISRDMTKRGARSYTTLRVREWVDS
jgi:hypothetical protein